MKLDEKIEILKSTPIFCKLTTEEIKDVADIAIEDEYRSGDIVFNENDVADAFYIIVSGIVEILKKGEEDQLEILAEKGDRKIFGEMAVVDELPRSATIKAKTDLMLLKIDKESFKRLLEKYSNISIEVARNICQTVRTTNSNYINDLELRNKQLELAYAKLKKTQDELIRAEKLSVIGKFASLIIHDIKNPMSNIRAYAELIKLGNMADTKIQKSTKVIISEVDRLTKMTGELLEFSRGEFNLNKTPVHFSALLENLIDTVREELKSKNIKISIGEKVDTVIVLDTEKIKRIFYNIIGNASDAIGSDGNIVVGAKEGDGYLKWYIQDNGCGMTKEILHKIFEPFYTNKKKGTGLGMAIVKSIVESHNGKIKVFSKKDIGTKFEIWLPSL